MLFNDAWSQKGHLASYTSYTCIKLFSTSIIIASENIAIGQIHHQKPIAQGTLGTAVGMFTHIGPHKLIWEEQNGYLQSSEKLHSSVYIRDLWEELDLTDDTKCPYWALAGCPKPIFNTILDL